MKKIPPFAKHALMCFANGVTIDPVARIHEAPKNHYFSWDDQPEALLQLKQLLIDGVAVKDIARIMGRSERSIDGAKRKYKLSKRVC